MQPLLLVGIVLGSHLDGGGTPVLSVVVTAGSEASTGQGLRLSQACKKTKNDGNVDVKLELHQSVRHGL